MADRDDKVAAGKGHTERDEPADPETRMAGQSLSAPSIISYEPSDVEVACYTMALKEYGDRTGHKALYDISFVTLDPPLERFPGPCTSPRYAHRSRTITFPSALYMLLRTQPIKPLNISLCCQRARLQCYRLTFHQSEPVF